MPVTTINHDLLGEEVVTTTTTNPLTDLFGDGVTGFNGRVWGTVASAAAQREELRGHHVAVLRGTIADAALAVSEGRPVPYDAEELVKALLRQAGKRLGLEFKGGRASFDTLLEGEEFVEALDAFTDTVKAIAPRVDKYGPLSGFGVDFAKMLAKSTVVADAFANAADLRRETVAAIEAQAAAEAAEAASKAATEASARAWEVAITATFEQDWVTAELKKAAAKADALSAATALPPGLREEHLRQFAAFLVENPFSTRKARRK